MDLPKPTTASTAAVATTTTEPLSPDCQRIGRLTDLPLAAKVNQLLLIGVADYAQAEAALSGPDPAAGIFLSGDSDWIADGALKSLAAASTIPPITAADEEGGLVTRISPEFGPMPSAYEMGSTMSTGAVEELADRRGHDMASLGLTMDLAPDADLYDSANVVIGSRAFSSDPNQVVDYDSAFEEGLKEAGILSVIKHFPGHGHSTGNDQYQVSYAPPFSEIEKADLIPFERLAPTTPAVMVSQLDVPGLTEPGTPASLSPAAMSLLRHQIGFEGLIFTDDLSMGAITSISSVSQAAIRAIAAGADIALVTPTYSGERTVIVDALEAAVNDGTISEAKLTAAIDQVEVIKATHARCPVSGGP